MMLGARRNLAAHFRLAVKRHIKLMRAFGRLGSTGEDVASSHIVAVELMIGIPIRTK